MEPIRQFLHCPRCGAELPSPSVGATIHCSTCDFLYFFNPAVAVAAILLDREGRALFIRRAKEPAKGKLAAPGGFVDANETAEDALRREVLEEVNLEVSSLRYLGSFPNLYPYKGVTYPVLDLFFIAHANSTDKIAALDGVESYLWLDPRTVDLKEIAFTSMREALRLYRTRIA